MIFFDQNDQNVLTNIQNLIVRESVLVKNLKNIFIFLKN